MPPVTFVIPGDGTNALAGAIPAGYDVIVHSVVATVDAAGGATVCELTIADPSGEVIADKDQTLPIAAGKTARATWALRLDDDVAAAAAATSAPSVATFWLDSDSGDTPITVAADSSATITWPHAKLPSDGLITGPFIGDRFVQFNGPCMTVEFLYTIWDEADYLKAGILGTDDRIGNNDVFALAAAGIGGSSGTGQRFGDGTFYPRLNAHIANDLIHGYAQNGDAVAHDVLFARLSIFAWPAPGYTGLVPGYPP